MSLSEKVFRYEIDQKEQSPDRVITVEDVREAVRELKEQMKYVSCVTEGGSFDEREEVTSIDQVSMNRIINEIFGEKLL